MPDCAFELIGDKRIRCKVCGTVLHTKVDPAKVQRTCGVVGLGDAVSYLTKALGIDACKGCLARHERMNHWLGISSGK